jgi:transcriptional regulator with XRE-family HTH domain
MLSSQFGALLRQLRLRAEMTQERLAERSTVGVRTIRGLETGERADPRVGTVRRLADALELAAPDRVALLTAAGHVGPEPVPEPRAGSMVANRLTEAAAQLAHAVRARWQREEEQRQVHDPFPLPVRWQHAPADLTDSWANIRRMRGDAPAEPLDLTGQLGEIVDVYQRIPSGRLVVLGRAGSGKTILTLRFVLDLLSTRTDAEPVPVIFNLGAWHPTTPLRDWLTDQLLRDHPGLSAPGPDGSTLAAALVETDRILPVLDGFDEIAAGLHRTALRAINATTLPVLLTSRPQEYADAVAGTDVLTAAGGVTLSDLTVDDLAGYLPRTTRRTGRGGSVWQPVLRALRDHPDSHLAAVLTTPLMVGLARTIYSDTPDHDPTELLDTDRFPTAAAVEEHLLGNFVPIVYQGDSTRFDAERVPHWLGYLATHLDRLGTHDLAWWQFGTSMRRPARALVVALVVGPIMGLVDLILEGLLGGEVNTYLVVFAALLAVVAGLAFGLAHELVASFQRAALEPTRVRLRLRGRMTRTRTVFAVRFRIGATVGFVLGFLYGLVRELTLVVTLGIWQGLAVLAMNAVVFGIMFGIGCGLVFGLMSWCETPMDIASAGSPADLLRQNRTTVAVQLLVFGPAFALAVPFVSWLVVVLLQQLPSEIVWGLEFYWSPLFGLALGSVGALGGGLGYALSMTGWGQWVVFGRLWLPLTGRLPWALPAFLDDAYRRGVLRRAGAVYQFRHARLQDHLARFPR